MPDESDMPPSDLVVLIHQYLADPESTWSIASFGAIAEFHADAGFIKSEAQDRGGGGDNPKWRFANRLDQRRAIYPLRNPVQASGLLDAGR